MKVAVIGGGFYGCYIANKLSGKHKIDIYENDKNVFLKYKNLLNIEKFSEKL